MHSQLASLQTIAVKFQQQMKSLLQSEQEDQLIGRVNKAIAYFTKTLTEEILLSLDHHIAAVKSGKKVKKHLKYVRQLRNSVARKINNLQKVQFGEIVFNPAAVEVPVMQENVTGGKREKQEKGSSLRETLSLLKSGMKPAEVAARRSLAVSTIEGHMAQLIKSGDIDIHDCIEQNRLANILAIIREIQPDSMQAVKHKLGDAFSYGEIRAVLNHLEFLEANNQEP
jgi:uncharacterized protein YpbB